ncbi:MAG TPA: hypothetical protein VFW96_05955 [Thermomicrobiales bacterium]|nr:hypothetical protein [Thermomicrobiales bacterium]
MGETRAGAGQFWYGDDALWVVLPADGVLWSTKFGWWRTAHGQLSITGRRLDGPAPPLDAEIPSGYGDAGFQVSGLEFPTPGCWAVAGSVAGRELRFVARVYPRAYWPPAASCGDLADTVRHSDLIVVGTVEGDLPDRPGFAWRTVRVTRALAWRGTTPQGDRMDVLQWTDVEPPLERGHAYVLFLRSRDGTPWRVVCPGLTLAEVRGDHVVVLNAQVKPLWAGDTLDGLAAQIAALVASEQGTPAP